MRHVLNLLLDRANCSRDMADFLFIKMAAIRPFGFFKSLTFYLLVWFGGLICIIEWASMRHCTKFSTDWSNHLGDIAIFLFFKIAAVRHLGFLIIGNFTCWCH